MADIQLALDFNVLRETSNIWIRRASIFLGLATNAAKADPPLSHELDDRVQYRFVATDVSEEQRSEFLEEFQTFVMASALRELAEGHSSFLRHAYYYAEILAARSIEKSALDDLCTAYEEMNIIRQREKLCQLLAVQDDFELMFSSILKARNCLAHRNGIIAERDENEPGALQLSWRFIGVKLQVEDGLYKFIDLNAGDDGRVLADTGIQIGPVDKHKIFPLGSQIRLSRHELSEIVLGFHLAAEVIVSGLMKKIPASATT